MAFDADETVFVGFEVGLFFFDVDREADFFIISSSLKSNSPSTNTLAQSYAQMRLKNDNVIGIKFLEP